MNRLTADTHQGWKRRANDSPNRPHLNTVNLAKFYPTRSREVRKGDYGKVVIAGGSEKYAGCLAFNALAALRAGADLTIVVAPQRAADIVAGYSPDLITVPCSTSFPDPQQVAEAMVGADTLIIGCGVIRTRKAHNVILSIIQKTTTPIVADAEALHAIATKPSITRGKRMLLTPNAGEFRVLTNKRWAGSGQDRRRAILSIARLYRASVIVKGSEDYVSDGTRVYVDPEGSPYMTKGGYGDLLAGVAGAMLARGNTPFDAASVAARIVGRAGRIAAAKLGESTLASDALNQIAAVIAQK